MSSIFSVHQPAVHQPAVHQPTDLPGDAGLRRTGSRRLSSFLFPLTPLLPTTPPRWHLSRSSQPPSPPDSSPEPPLPPIAWPGSFIYSLSYTGSSVSTFLLKRVQRGAGRSGRRGGEKKKREEEEEDEGIIHIFLYLSFPFYLPYDFLIHLNA